VDRVGNFSINSYLTRFPFTFKLKADVNHLEGGMGENKVVYLFELKKNFYPHYITSEKEKCLILNSGFKFRFFNF